MAHFRKKILIFVSKKYNYLKFRQMADEKIKTANDHTHNYSKKFDRYLKTKSTRSLDAITRTKRLDLGFFWMEFYPLVRDIFLAKHPYFTERHLDVILQLHASQPFCMEDTYKCLAPKIHNGLRLSGPSRLGKRSVKKLFELFFKHKFIKVFKNNGRYNKKLYIFTPDMNNEIRKMYDNMLCLTKINSSEVPKELRDKQEYIRKIAKQNVFKERLTQEGEREIETSDRSFSIRLKDARIDARRTNLL